jgi:hypothetical protein
MRVVEAVVGGVVAAVGGVFVANRIHFEDLAVAGVLPFVVVFLAVLLRPASVDDAPRRRR